MNVNNGTPGVDFASILQTALRLLEACFRLVLDHTEQILGIHSSCIHFSSWTQLYIEITLSGSKMNNTLANIYVFGEGQ